jgi:hypothetical protein
MKSPHLIDLEEASVPTESAFQDPPPPLGVRFVAEIKGLVQDLLVPVAVVIAISLLAALVVASGGQKDRSDRLDDDYALYDHRGGEL